MSYTVLARKFRSQTFDEIIGQKAITTTLRNAIEADRVHHGYLFCGTRGVGKTSMARILAKSLNCLSSDGPTVDPCGTCDSCESIARGEDMDVIEIDAASHTGVDDVRQLRANAIYRPARARHKIYIIDEVHMLSTSAFNALLKTLEEPPDHVKFILATTETQKVPATIQSRVQRFEFKSITVSDIADQLVSICKQEQVEAEDAGIRRIARLANGSMRDALSLLDQVLSMSGAVSSTAVDELLPATHDELLGKLIDRIAEGDAAGALAAADESLNRGCALDHWCTLLIGQMRDLMMLRVCGPDSDLVDAPAGLRSELAEQSTKFDAGAYVTMITILEELRRAVKFSGSARALIEAAIVRLAESASFSSIETLIGRLGESNDPEPAPRPVRAASAAVVPQPATTKKKEPLSRVADTNQPPADTADTGATAAPAPPSPALSPPAPAAPMIPAFGGRVTQADIKAANAEPMIRAVVEVFEGKIVDVQRGTGGRVSSQPTTD